MGRGEKGASSALKWPLPPPLLLTRLKGAVFGCYASWLVRASEVNCSDSSCALPSILQSGWHCTGRRWHLWPQAPTQSSPLSVVVGITFRQDSNCCCGVSGQVWENTATDQRGHCSSLGRGPAGPVQSPMSQHGAMPYGQPHCPAAAAAVLRRSLPTTPMALGSPVWGPHKSPGGHRGSLGHSPCTVPAPHSTDPPAQAQLLRSALASPKPPWHWPPSEPLESPQSPRPLMGALTPHTPQLWGRLC